MRPGCTARFVFKQRLFPPSPRPLISDDSDQLPPLLFCQVGVSFSCQNCEASKSQVEQGCNQFESANYAWWQVHGHFIRRSSLSDSWTALHPHTDHVLAISFFGSNWFRTFSILLSLAWSLNVSSLCLFLRLSFFCSSSLFSLTVRRERKQNTTQKTVFVLRFVWLCLRWVLPPSSSLFLVPLLLA